MSETARLGLPMMQPGQSQKEMIHNEALTLIDIAVHAGVLAVGMDVPPEDPAVGACWVVGGAPVGRWAGHAGRIAGWTEGGWRFVSPRDGFLLWCTTEGVPYRYEGVGWHVARIVGSAVEIGGDVVVQGRQPAIIPGTGGTTVDAEARGTIVEILAALRSHGLIEDMVP